VGAENVLDQQGASSPDGGGDVLLLLLLRPTREELGGRRGEPRPSISICS
jgi:hypothetical protein